KHRTTDTLVIFKITTNIRSLKCIFHLYYILTVNKGMLKHMIRIPFFKLFSSFTYKSDRNTQVRRSMSDLTRKSDTKAQVRWSLSYLTRKSDTKAQVRQSLSYLAR